VITAPSRHYAMSMLESGVPLSLLLDLAIGVNSEDLLAEERTQPWRPTAPRL
jgi:hypothetical protein